MKRNANAGWTQERFRVPANLGDHLFTRRFVMEDPFGFHGRPAVLLAKTVQPYDADVMVGRKGGSFVNGKSILGLLTLGRLCGDELMVTAEGPDAAEAVSAIESLFAGGFGQSNRSAHVTRNADASCLAACRT